MEAIAVKNRLLQPAALYVIAALISISGTAAAEADNALILRGGAVIFEEVVSGLTDDLEGELHFDEYVVSRDTTAKDVQRFIRRSKPRIIVLIGNRAVNAYYKHQRTHSDSNFPPSLSLAALQIDKLVSNLNNATGIRYEIPAVTSIVNLRSLLKGNLKRVGVLYRSWMRDIIDENKAFCRREGIELIGYEIPQDNRQVISHLKIGAKKLLKEDVDAFWVINDNVLLNERTLLKSWLPSLSRAKKPVIVGVKALLSTKLNFGSYAIIPDHYALGVQGANVIAEIMEQDWKLGGRQIEQPLSVKKIVNISVLNNKKIEFIDRKLDEVDEVIR